MDHIVKLSDFVIRIRDHRKVERRALRLANVLGPALVRIGLIHAQADHFDVALIEFRFQPRGLAQLSSADRSEILWMRKQYRPAIANPFMKADRPFSGFRVKVRRHIA